jgi:hypothetical protein
VIVHYYCVLGCVMADRFRLILVAADGNPVEGVELRLLPGPTPIKALPFAEPDAEQYREFDDCD